MAKIPTLLEQNFLTTTSLTKLYETPRMKLCEIKSFSFCNIGGGDANVTVKIRRKAAADLDKQYFFIRAIKQNKTVFVNADVEHEAVINDGDEIWVMTDSINVAVMFFGKETIDEF